MHSSAPAASHRVYNAANRENNLHHFVLNLYSQFLTELD